MPKQKTHRASAKRFKRTGSGGLETLPCLHILTVSTEKLKKQRRHLRKASMVHPQETFKRIKAMASLACDNPLEAFAN